jgi:outer membrane protein insertion porin family
MGENGNLMRFIVLLCILLSCPLYAEKVWFHFDRFLYSVVPDDKTKPKDNDYKKNKEYTTILGFKEGVKISTLEFSRGIARLEKFFKDSGYLDVSIDFKTKDDHKLNKRLVLILIKTGVRYKISKVEITGNKYFSNEQILKELDTKVDDYFDRNLIITALERVRKKYNEEGFIKTEINFESSVEDKASHHGGIRVLIEEGDRYKINEIKIMGNSRIRDRIIMREIPFKKGDYLNLTTMYEVQKNIYKLGLFRDIEFIPETSKDKKDEVNIVIRVIEDKFNFVRLNIGIGPYLDAVHMDKAWGHNNLGGNNQQLSFGNFFYYRFGVHEKHHFYRIRPNIGYTEPWLGGYNLSYHAELYYQIEQVYWHRYIWGEKLRLFRQYNLKKTLVYIEHNYEQRRTADVDTMQAPDYILEEEAQGKRVKDALTPGIEFDSRDDPFYPLKGFFNQASFTFAGGPLGGDDFYEIIGSLSRYERIYKNVTIGMHAYGGMIQVYGKNTSNGVSSDDLFFSGGANTFRGEEALQLGPMDNKGNALGGVLLALGNLELRYPIYWLVGGVVFFDVGQLWGKRQDARLSDLRYAYGLGFRYKTSIGPIRLEYGVDTKKPIKNGNYHIAFGQSF